MSFYRERFGHRPGEFPVCEDVAERSLALPFFPAMSEGQVARVAEAYHPLHPTLHPRTDPRCSSIPTLHPKLTSPSTLAHPTTSTTTHTYLRTKHNLYTPTGRAYISPPSTRSRRRRSLRKTAPRRPRT